jgi:hypothetical protein
MDKELHAQKLNILSRLIKESSLTLEEALLLLKEEETLPIVNAPFQQSQPFTSYPTIAPTLTPGDYWFGSITGDGTVTINNTHGSFMATTSDTLKIYN